MLQPAASVLVGVSWADKHIRQTALALLQLAAAGAPVDTIKAVMGATSDAWTPQRLARSALSAGE